MSRPFSPSSPGYKMPWRQAIPHVICKIFQPYSVADWTGSGGLAVSFTTKRRAIAAAKAMNVDAARLSLMYRTYTAPSFTMANVLDHVRLVHGEWSSDGAR